MEEMTKEWMEYQQRAQNLLNKYSAQKYKYYKCKLMNMFQDVMLDILQLRARYTAPVLDGQILARMMDFNEDEFTYVEHNDKNMDINTASGFAYLLILTGKVATAFKAWGKFEITTAMLECLTKRLRYPNKEKIDTTNGFPFECIQFGKTAYKQPNQSTRKLAKTIASEMEQFAVEITLGMKASRSKCVKGAEVYRNR
jgi:hypothetical protein